MTSDDCLAKLKALGGERLPFTLETLEKMNRYYRECATYWAYPKMPKYVKEMLEDLRLEDHKMWSLADAYAYLRLEEEQWEFKAIWET